MMPDGLCEPFRSPVRNSRPTSLAFSSSASMASSMPRPRRLCSWTTRVTATPEERISPGELHGSLQLGTLGRAGGDLLREDAGHPDLGEEVELCVEELPGGRGPCVAEADVSDRFGAGTHGPGQFGPRRARLAYGGGRHAERLGELRHETEAGGVVLDGHLALAGPARGARGGRTGGHRTVVRFHALEVSLTSPDCSMRVFQTSSRLQRLMRHDRRRWTAGRPGVSRATTYETTPFKIVP